MKEVLHGEESKRVAAYVAQSKWITDFDTRIRAIAVNISVPVMAEAMHPVVVGSQAWISVVVAEAVGRHPVGSQSTSSR